MDQSFFVKHICPVNDFRHAFDVMIHYMIHYKDIALSLSLGELMARNRAAPEIVDCCVLFTPFRNSTSPLGRLPDNLLTGLYT